MRRRRGYRPSGFRDDSQSVALSADERFLFFRPDERLTILRLADGARLHQVFPAIEGAEALSFTDEGLFDGGPEASKLALYRLGADVAHAELVSADTVEANGRCPGLREDFFAGRPPRCPGRAAAPPPGP